MTQGSGRDLSIEQERRAYLRTLGMHRSTAQKAGYDSGEAAQAAANARGAHGCENVDREEIRPLQSERGEANARSERAALCRSDVKTKTGAAPGGRASFAAHCNKGGGNKGSPAAGRLS